IQAVAFDSKKHHLVLDAHMDGRNSDFSRGEVYLDLRYFRGLERRVPATEEPAGQAPFIDLSQSAITVVIDAPHGAAGAEFAPSGVQVFVKDVGFRSQYGAWVDISE